jgi:hypothetical protein
MDLKQVAQTGIDMFNDRGFRQKAEQVKENM